MFAHEMHATLRWLSTDPVDLRRINGNTALGVCARGFVRVCICVHTCNFSDMPLSPYAYICILLYAILCG